MWDLNLYRIISIGHIIVLLVIVICSILKIFGKSKSLYMQLVVFSLAAVIFSRVNYILVYELMNIHVAGFNIADLGLVAAFMFVLSANYGTMDGIIDERNKEHSKYRKLSLIAPACMTLLIVIFLLSEVTTSTKIEVVVICIPAVVSSYYNLKHLIFPDLGQGFLQSMRRYNLFALIFVFSNVLMFLSEKMGIYYIASLFIVVSAIVSGMMVFACKKGLDNWKKM